MPISKPYRRTCRQLSDGSYANSGHGRYILHPLFAKSPEHYVRAFLMLLKDTQSLFDYVEPSDSNLQCYSYRIHEILLRVCIEVEANCKAILDENGYVKSGDWNMGDYKKIETSHKLSSYQVKLPVWQGTQSVRAPFAAWAEGKPLAWYQAYNTTKHDRHNAFQQATFEHMIDAICGLLVVLSAQFHTEDFAPSDPCLSLSGYGPNDGMESAMGGYFRIKFPNNWSINEQYNFNWDVLKNETDPFQNYNYNQTV